MTDSSTGNDDISTPAWEKAKKALDLLNVKKPETHTNNQNKVSVTLICLRYLNKPKVKCPILV